jgi:hypothetical protein
MMDAEKFDKAIALIDLVNSKDPNLEKVGDKEYPKEFLYALRMTKRLEDFTSDASEALQLAVRSQHVCRWEIPRENYEMNRTGYLKWRKELKDFHAEKTEEILKEVGYNDELIGDVKFLIKKKELKRNEDTQTLEDVVCLVFLEHYFVPFSEKYDEEKMIGILQKTWSKMSEKGRKAALEIDLPTKSAALIKKALAS